MTHDPNATASYLGDGVYIDRTEDPQMLKIWTSDGDSDTNVIYLDQSVLKNLVVYARYVGLL